MSKQLIGKINNRLIFTGDANLLCDGEYYISIEDGKPSGLFVNNNGKLVPLQNMNCQEVNIMSNYHGNEVEVVPGKGYDGISKVTYRKPKLEEKDVITITKNCTREIKISEGYDGLDELTIVVDIKKQ